MKGASEFSGITIKGISTQEVRYGIGRKSVQNVFSAMSDDKVNYNRYPLIFRQM